VRLKKKKTQKEKRGFAVVVAPQEISKTNTEQQTNRRLDYNSAVGKTSRDEQQRHLCIVAATHTRKANSAD
jgi:hypothetical protein